MVYCKSDTLLFIYLLFGTTMHVKLLLLLAYNLDCYVYVCVCVSDF